MKTKVNKMNKKAIKFINNIALTLILSMTVFVACQKDAGIVPNNTSAANSGLTNKEVAFNSGIYDQVAGDPLFTAYYEALMQLKEPLYNKVIKERSIEKNEKLIASINDALENNNLRQVFALMGYESLECYMAKSATLHLASSKLFEKYPSISPENPGELEKVFTKYSETYHNTPNGSILRLGTQNSILSLFDCGAACHETQVPDKQCCDKALEVYYATEVGIAAALAAAFGGCWWALAPPAIVACEAIALASAAAATVAAYANYLVEARYCCKPKKKG